MKNFVPRFSLYKKNLYLFFRKLTVILTFLSEKFLKKLLSLFIFQLWNNKINRIKSKFKHWPKKLKHRGTLLWLPWSIFPLFIAKFTRRTVKSFFSSHFSLSLSFIPLPPNADSPWKFSVGIHNRRPSSSTSVGKKIRDWKFSEQTGAVTCAPIKMGMIFTSPQQAGQSFLTLLTFIGVCLNFMDSSSLRGYGLFLTFNRAFFK